MGSVLTAQPQSPLCGRFVEARKAKATRKPARTSSRESARRAAARRRRGLGTANTQPELSQGAKGGATMESESLRLHLAIALKAPEIRRACCAVEPILRAADKIGRASCRERV